LQEQQRLAGCEKRRLRDESSPQRLKAVTDSERLRGPEGPLFHGAARMRKFFPQFS